MVLKAHIKIINLLCLGWIYKPTSVQQSNKWKYIFYNTDYKNSNIYTFGIGSGLQKEFTEFI
jgi:hypothetical protein